MVGQLVTIEAVVTGRDRRGFFVQSVEARNDPLVSDAVYVYSPKWRADVGSMVRVTGKVADFVRGDNDKPVTQIRLNEMQLIEQHGPSIEAVELTHRMCLKTRWSRLFF